MGIRNNRIDFFRGIACLLIVFIHYPFPGILGRTISLLARSAVPFFFLVSGYYTNKIDKKLAKQEVKARIKKNAVLCVGAVLFCELMQYVFFFRHMSILTYISNCISLHGIIKFILLHNMEEVLHLWFLPALLYCYIVLYLILSGQGSFFTDYKKVDGIAVAAWLMAVGMAILLPKAYIEFYRNGYFMGFSFFWAGYRLGEIKLPYLCSRWKWCMIAGCGSLVLEVFIFGMKELSIGSSLLAVAALLYSVEDVKVSMGSLLVYIGRNLSLYIYILHWHVRYVEYKLISMIPLLQKDEYGWISPIMVCVYSIIAAWFCYCLHGYWKEKMDGKRKRVLPKY